MKERAGKLHALSKFAFHKVCKENLRNQFNSCLKAAFVTGGAVKGGVTTEGEGPS